MNSSLLNNSMTVFHSFVFFNVFFIASIDDIFVFDVEEGLVSLVILDFCGLTPNLGPRSVFRNDPQRPRNSFVGGSLKNPKPPFWVI